MKKTMLLLLMCLPLLSVFGQDEGDDSKWEKRWEVRAGWGAESSYSWTETREPCFGCDYDYVSPRIDLADKRPLGNKYTTGAIWAGASINLSRFWDVGATVTYNRFWQDFAEGREKSSYIGLQALGRINYINTKIVRLYSALAIGGHAVVRGGEFDTNENDCELIADFHLTGIGVSVGKTFFGFTEYGIGPKGIITAGVGYRFK